MSVFILFLLQENIFNLNIFPIFSNIKQLLQKFDNMNVIIPCHFSILEYYTDFFQETDDNKIKIKIFPISFGLDDYDIFHFFLKKKLIIIEDSEFFYLITNSMDLKHIAKHKHSIVEKCIEKQENQDTILEYKTNQGLKNTFVMSSHVFEKTFSHGKNKSEKQLQLKECFQWNEL
jgi:hypothetical protein